MKGSVRYVPCSALSYCCVECSIPTGPFKILGLQDLEIVEAYLAQERRTSDFEAPKL